MKKQLTKLTHGGSLGSWFLRLGTLKCLLTLMAMFVVSGVWADEVTYDYEAEFTDNNSATFSTYFTSHSTSKGTITLESSNTGWSSYVKEGDPSVTYRTSSLGSTVDSYDAAFNGIKVTGTTIKSISFLCSSNSSTSGTTYQPILLGWKSSTTMSNTIDYSAECAQQSSTDRTHAAASWITFDVSNEGLTAVRLYRQINKDKFTKDGETYLPKSSSSSSVRVWGIRVVLNESVGPKVNAISVKTAPTKVSYTAGEYFNPAGLVITKTMSEGDPEDVTYSDATASDFTFAPSTSTALATTDTKVTITYGGKSVDQAITVAEPVYTGTLVNVALNGGTKVPTVTGTPGGTGAAYTQSSADTDGGYKFGNAGHYVGVTLANGATFKTGDVLKINITSACTSSSAELGLFTSNSDNAFVCSTGVTTATGVQTFVLPAAYNGKSSLYLYRATASIEGKSYGWNGFIKSFEVKRPQSVEFGGVKVAGETLATEKYTTEGKTITLVDKYSLAPTVALIENTVFSATDVEATDVAVTLGDAAEGYFTGTATVAGEEYTVKVPVDNTPVMSLSPETGSVSMKSYEASASTKTTLTGSNLTNGTYSVTAPANVTVEPASFTVADGAVSQEFTITASAAMENATVTFSDGTTSKTFTLTATKTAKREVEQASVSAATTWDWSKVGTTAVQLTATTSPTNAEEFILGTIAEVANDANFNSAALKVNNADWPNRIEGSNQYGQMGIVKFTATVAGTIKVKFSNTGKDRPYRYLNVNGVNTEYKSNTAAETVTSGEINVPAGEVTIKGHFTTNSSEIVDNGDGTSTLEGGTTAAFTVANEQLDATQYLRIYFIEFTPGNKQPEPTVADTVKVNGTTPSTAQKEALAEVANNKNVIIDNKVSESVSTNIPSGATSYIQTSMTKASMTDATITELIFDVHPVYKESGATEATEISNNDITKAITFRLPIPQATKLEYVLVKHGTANFGCYPVQNEANGDTKYIELKSASFSEYTVDLTGSTSITETRSTKVGSYGTICLPYTATATGATLLQMDGKVNNGAAIQFIVVDGNTLTAGVPYVYRATASEQKFTTAENATYVDPITSTGFVGVYETTDISQPDATEGATTNLLLSSNEFRPAGNYVDLPAYRCYIPDLKDVPAVGSTAKAGAVLFGLSGGGATGINAINFNDASTSSAQAQGKFVKNGKFVIVKNGKQYNAAGQIVK